MIPFIVLTKRFRALDDVSFSVVIFVLAVFVIGLLKNVVPKDIGFDKMAGAFYLVVASFSIGALFASLYLRADYDLHTLKLNTGDIISGRIIRGGERGILFYDRKQDMLEFRRWDEINVVQGKPRLSQN